LARGTAGSAVGLGAGCAVFILSLQCNLTGTWQNDLGSNMTITVNSEGKFNGSYHTAVSANTSHIKVSPLQGFQHNPKAQPTFGFTVNWTFSDSTTVFTGQCFVDDKDKEWLKTMWLLRQRAKSLHDDWKATR
ncbi:AVID protein, partial [Crypturellus undulatus]|nr:AVID protein [Crypturellus undulatus]